MPYTEKDLVDFGNYMVSPNRKKSFKKRKASIPLVDRLATVHHADIENWKGREKKKK